MKIAHNEEMQWIRWPSVRGTSSLVKILLQGESGRIDDYEFMLSKMDGGDQYSPRHRHVFDQFRYAVKGEVPYDPTHSIPEGGVAYFPEGTPYGPFALPQGMILLSLQFGGANGLGHLHTEDLQAAHNALAKEGKFEKGVYTYFDADGGKHNKDAHRAIWERITRQPVEYPEPRYADPVLMYPQNYQWRQTAPSVHEKMLGVFNERGTCAKMLRFDPDTIHEWKGVGQASINFIIDGDCLLDGETCERYDAFRLETDDRAEFKAKTETTVLSYGMPVF